MSGAKGNPESKRIGGLIRDDSGQWVTGYYGKMEVCSSINVKIESLRRGLIFVVEKGLEVLEFEIDSKSVCALMKGDLTN